MKKKVRSIIDQALKKARDSGELQLADMPDIVVEQPKDEKLGDFATTIAMNLARSERKPPREIAAILCGHLQNGAGLVESVQTAGPGFINIKMSPSFFQDQFLQAVKLGDDFGKSEIGKDQKVHLEFVSANPTGPLHVGHGRGAAVGHTLSQILKRAGYDVHTEYYVNDVGNQMNTLG
ncbi:MAG: arginine--tRNA ligase, partial [Nitrospinales bacterium]